MPTVRECYLNHYCFFGFFVCLDLSEKQLHNNTRICKELLRLADVLEPGITRFRGMLLYYLVCGLKRLMHVENNRVSVRLCPLCITVTMRLPLPP